MTTPDPFHALRASLEKATPGPWTREKPGADENGWPLGVAVAGTPGRQTIYASPPGGCFPSADADLIVELRNTAPQLLAALDEARAEVGRYREALERIVSPVQWQARHLKPGEEINATALHRMMEMHSFYAGIASAALRGEGERKL